MSEQENENKEIEVVKGDGSELDFYPVYEHLNAAKPKPKDEKKKNIITMDVLLYYLLNIKLYFLIVKMIKKNLKFLSMIYCKI